MADRHTEELFDAAELAALSLYQALERQRQAVASEVHRARQRIIAARSEYRRAAPLRPPVPIRRIDTPEGGPS